MCDFLGLLVGRLEPEIRARLRLPHAEIDTAARAESERDIPRIFLADRICKLVLLDARDLRAGGGLFQNIDQPLRQGPPGCNLDQFDRAAGTYPYVADR